MSFTDTDIINFLDKWHTLHFKVEALYIVEGYKATLTYDENEIVKAEGETLRQAYIALMKLELPVHPSDRCNDALYRKGVE